MFLPRKSLRKSVQKPLSRSPIEGGVTNFSRESDKKKKRDMLSTICIPATRKTSVIMSNFNALTNCCESLSSPELSVLQSTTTTQLSEQEKFVNLNLYGRIFKMDRANLVENERESLLKKFALLSHKERLKIANSYCSVGGSYYFCRSPLFFEYILHYMATGIVHCPPNVCPEMFLSELKFWHVNTDAVGDCCRAHLGLPDLPSDPDQEDGDLARTSLANGSVIIINGEPTRPMDSDPFAKLFCGTLRRKLWYILEQPSSSFVAKVFATASVGFIVVSVVTLILGSMREFQKEDKEPHNILENIEYFCIAWFTFEYFFRLLVTPNKWEFIKNVINIIDAISIFPFYFEFTLMVSGHTATELSNLKGALLAMRVLRVLRVARLFKLARYSGGLQSFIRTLTSSHKEIGMLLMFLSTGVLLFSTTVYFMEKDAENSPFTSIPATFWWAIVTMTTVGYGDMIPVTFGGKLIASFATIAGVIVLAFPITMIVENFCRHYQMDVYRTPVPDAATQTAGGGGGGGGDSGRPDHPSRFRGRLHVKSAGII